MSTREELPKSHDIANGFLSAEYDKYLTTFLDKLSWGPNEVILDHGCGSGYYAANLLAPRVQDLEGCRIYAIDRTASLIKFAEENHADEKVTYAPTDLLAPTFPYKDLKFTKVFSLNVLNFLNVEDIQPNLQRIYDLLVPGGQFVLIDCIDSPNYELRWWLKDHHKWGPRIGQYLPRPLRAAKDETFWDETKKIFANRLEDAGFKICQYAACAGETTFPTIHSVAHFAMSLDPFSYEHVEDPEQFQQLLGDIMEFARNKQKREYPDHADDDDSYVNRYRFNYILMEKPADA